MRARRQHHAGDFLGILAPEAQQHEEGADLVRISLAAQDHPERGLRFVSRQGTRPAWSAAKGGDEGGEPGYGGMAHDQSP